MSDPVTANHEAIAVIGNIVKRQTLIIGLIDTLAIAGAVLTIAAVVLLFAQGYGRIRRSR
jgi:MFS transporter, DHA2 family, multidrug resistance protein